MIKKKLFCKEDSVPEMQKWGSAFFQKKMKADWWFTKATERQEAADRKDIKSFFDDLKRISGPRENGVTPWLSSNRQMPLSDNSDILRRWKHHFESFKLTTHHWWRRYCNRFPKYWNTRNIFQVNFAECLGCHQTDLFRQSRWKICYSAQNLQVWW